MPLNQGRFLILLSCLLFCLWAGFFPFLDSMLHWMDLSDVQLVYCFLWGSSGAPRGSGTEAESPLLRAAPLQLSPDAQLLKGMLSAYHGLLSFLPNTTPASYSLRSTCRPPPPSSSCLLILISFGRHSQRGTRIQTILHPSLSVLPKSPF